jgi:hypothetical protein
MTGRGVVFAVVFVAMYAAHEVGDHWLQTHSQAMSKGLPGWRGRGACARHVVTLTLVKAAAVAVAVAVLGLAVSPVAVTGALAADAVSHYWADRRVTLAALASWLGRTLVPGKGDFYLMGAPRPGHDDAPHLGTGAYALDQSWHIGCLFLAALLASVGAGVTS